MIRYNLKKTRRTLLICSAVIFIIMLVGCGQPVYELSEGAYVPVDGDASNSQMEISFDLKENRFAITAMDADIMTGTIKLGNGKVTAKTDDERFTYVFEIKDNNTICFIEDDSSSLVGVIGNGEQFGLAEDGMEFVFSGNKKP